MAYRIDPRDLLKTGAHFGHKTSRWHPKMARYIHSKKDSTHIIDLVKTAEQLESAQEAIEKIAATGGKVLFVSTKRQARTPVLEAAEANTMPYVVNRWPGGLLTNWQTMHGRIKHLLDLEKQMASGELAAKYNKLEIQRYQEEIDEMNVLYGGVKDMTGAPNAVVVAAVPADHIAIKEANKLNIPVFAIVDTNADPTDVDYVIPANDDAVKTITFVFEKLSEAIKNGVAKIKTPIEEKK